MKSADFIANPDWMPPVTVAELERAAKGTPVYSKVSCHFSGRPHTWPLIQAERRLDGVFRIWVEQAGGQAVAINEYSFDQISLYPGDKDPNGTVHTPNLRKGRKGDKPRGKNRSGKKGKP